MWRAHGLHASNFCRQCHDVRFFIRSLDDVGCHVDLCRNDVDCEISDVSFVVFDVDIAVRGHVCLVFGLADVDWDMKMSCGTSCSTGQLTLEIFSLMQCFVGHHM